MPQERQDDLNHGSSCSFCLILDFVVVSDHRRGSSFHLPGRLQLSDQQRSNLLRYLPSRKVLLHSWRSPNELRGKHVRNPWSDGLQRGSNRLGFRHNFNSSDILYCGSILQWKRMCSLHSIKWLSWFRRYDCVRNYEGKLHDRDSYFVRNLHAWVLLQRRH